MADEVVVKISGDTKGLDKELKSVTDSVGKMAKEVETSMSDAASSIGKQFDEIGSAINQIGISAGVAFAGIALTIKGFISDFTEADKVTRQLENTLKNNTSAIGITAKSVDDLSKEISSYSTFADTAIKKSAAMLLTFENMSKGVFPRAQRALADMSSVMGSLEGNTFALGKALSNPAEGLARLSRAGVRFTEEQKTLIKTLQASGDLLGAQGVILAEIEKRFGGMAEATGKGTGAFAKLSNAIGSISELIGEQLSNSLIGTVQLLTDMAKWLSNNKELVAFMATSLLTLAKVTAVLVTVATGLKIYQTFNKFLIEALKYLPSVTTQIGLLGETVTVTSAATKTFGSVAKTALGATGIGLFLVLLPDVINLLDKFWKALSSPETFNLDTVKTAAKSLSDLKDKATELTAELERRRSLGLETETTQIALKNVTKDINIVQGALDDWRKKQNDLRDAERKAAQDKLDKDAKDFHTRIQNIRDENAALISQAQIKVSYSKAASDELKKIEADKKAAMELNQSKERDDYIKNLNAQRDGLIQSNKEKLDIEIKYAKDKAELDKEKKKVEKTPEAAGGVEKELLLANIAQRQALLDEGHKKELETNVTKENEKLAQADEFRAQRMEIDAAYKEEDDALKLEEDQILLDMQNTKDADELARLELHLAEIRELRRKNATQAFTDKATYDKQIIALDKQTNQARLDGITSFLDLAMVVTKGKSKALYAVQQAFAVASAVVAAFQASALAAATPPGPPATAALSAWTLATGLAKAGAIAATAIQGFAAGGIVTGGMPNIDSVPIMAQSGELIAPRRNFDEVVNAVADKRNAEANGDISNSMSVVIQGNVIADSDEQVDRLIERINTAIEFRNTKLYGVT